jgi:hypothetical protein
MKTRRRLTVSRSMVLAVLLALLLAGGLTQAQEPQSPEGAQLQSEAGVQAAVGTAFTYQGRLTDGGNPANGEYDFEFTLYGAASSGTPVHLVKKGDVTVSDGLFTVELDFGSGIFIGEARYLEIGVRPGSSIGAYTTLSPRQELTPAPYALALPGLWTQQNATSPNLIGGYHGNSVSGGMAGATIGGGGASGADNQISGSYGTISGGYDNTAIGHHTTVAGGKENTASYWAAAVGGGYQNTASANCAAIGGGAYNETSGSYAAVGGGFDNTASITYTTVAGGHINEATGYAAAVCGGEDNHATNSKTFVGGGVENWAAGWASVVSGGYGNQAYGSQASVPGGYNNWANGDYSFAAGYQARATDSGSFVWSGGGTTTTNSWGDDTFTARAHGGVRFYSASGTGTGVQLVAGGGSWGTLSDRDAKENFADIDRDRLLDTLAEMPVQTWNIKAQSSEMRHIGPVAQDFNGEFAYLFGEVESPVHINSMDAVGVSLVAAQGLYERSQEQVTRIEVLEAENTQLRQQVDALEARLVALEAAAGGSPASRLQADLLTGGGILLAGLVLYWLIRRRATVLRGGE